MMKSPLRLFILVVVAGCGDTTRDNPPPVYDMAVRDLSVRPPQDLAMRPADLSAVVEDMTMTGQDLGPVDLRMPRDLSGRDLSVRDMARVDLAVAPDLAGRDLVMRPVDAAPPSDLAQSDGGASCHPIVNELMAGTNASGNDEFIELYNPCANDVVLTGWSLCYRAAGNVRSVDALNDANNIKFPMNATIKAGTYYVGCAAPYGGKCDWKYGNQGMMANAGGAVGLRDANGLLMNSVGYGGVMAMNAFVQTAAAPAPPLKAPPGGSIGRVPNAADTFDNSKDFKVTAAPTPGAANM